MSTAKYLLQGFFLLVFLSALSACQKDNVVVPTKLIVLTWTPSFTPTPSDTPIATNTPTSTSSLTPTRTLSPTPTATKTAVPTETFTPTETLTPTDTLSPTPTAAVGTLVGIGEISVRSGPGDDFEILFRIRAGEFFAARLAVENYEGEIWFFVEFGRGNVGWVSGDAIPLEPEENVELVDIAQLISPTPSPTASDTPTPTDTPTSTDTFTPTFTPTATFTETPSATPTATLTFTPSPTLPPHANAWIFSQQADRVSLRTGPGIGFEILAVLQNDAPVTVIGQSADGRWYQVVSYGVDAVVGWVSASLLRLSEEIPSDLNTIGLADAGSVELDCGINVNPVADPNWTNFRRDITSVQYVRIPVLLLGSNFASQQDAINFYDQTLDEYAHLNIQVILLLDERILDDPKEDMSDEDWEDYMGKFLGIVELLTQQYGNRVGGYQIWDTPEETLPAEVYARLLNISTQVIHSYAPTPLIVMGSIYSDTYLNQVLRALNDQLPIDALTLEVNEDTFTQPETLNKFVKQYASLAPGFPIWLTNVAAQESADAATMTGGLENLLTYIRAYYPNFIQVFMWSPWTNGLVDDTGAPREPLYSTFLRLCGEF